MSEPTLYRIDWDKYNEAVDRGRIQAETLSLLCGTLGVLVPVERCEEPHLGLATRRQLLQELEARIDLLGELDYRTVDGDRIGGEHE